jgi:ribosomal protein S18 acetylase RimI-like enzyme
MANTDFSFNALNAVGNYTLSAATEEDFDFVYQLKKIAYREYVEQTWGWDDQFQTKFHKDNFSVGNTKIIRAGDQPIGSVDVKEEDASIFISGLYLLPGHQSQGIGTKIMQDLIKDAEEKKKRLELEVLRVNTRAQKLYQRLGFKMEERDKEKYFMYKDLTLGPSP